METLRLSTKGTVHKSTLVHKVISHRVWDNNTEIIHDTENEQLYECMAEVTLVDKWMVCFSWLKWEMKGKKKKKIKIIPVVIH